MWTKTAPTEPGYYWVVNHMMPAKLIRVFKLIPDDDRDPLVASIDGAFWPIVDLPYYWAVPVPPSFNLETPQIAREQWKNEP